MLTFLGIGAQKCGSTWLYELLSLHPQVRFPAGKEVHFWDAQRDRGLAWYRGLFEDAPPQCASGEITPAYAILGPERVGEIAREFPDLRLFYLMRNPIERAWSSALMALQRAELTIEEASDRWFIDHFESRGSRARGDFESCIRTWRGAFGQDRLELIRYESIRAQPFEVYARCCGHLGIAPIDSPRIREQAGRVVFAGSGEPIRQSLLLYLRGMYRTPIESLSRYLDADLSDWLAP